MQTSEVMCMAKYTKISTTVLWHDFRRKTVKRKKNQTAVSGRKMILLSLFYNILSIESIFIQSITVLKKKVVPTPLSVSICSKDTPKTPRCLVMSSNYCEDIF